MNTIRDARWKQLLAAVLAAQVVVAGCSTNDPSESADQAGVYTPPAEDTAFDVPGEPPAATDQSLMSTAAVGRLPGAGNVTKDGSYAYTLPISIPPGRAGMTPGIALRYDSRSGNGQMGVGWSVSAGQSMITRCAKSFASGSAPPRRRPASARPTA